MRPERLLPSFVALFFLAACGQRPDGVSGSADLRDEPVTAEVPRFASGSFEDISWEARFNFPTCDHSADGRRAGAWCESTDQQVSIDNNGVEAELQSWISDERIKAMQLAYFSFSNATIAEALCSAAADRGLKVNLFIHNQSMDSPAVRRMQDCMPELVKVTPRGGTFGADGEFIQHAKIFLASEMSSPMPLADALADESLSAEDRRLAAEGLVRFTSSSANMSGFGTSLHFENWLFFETNHANHTAQSNLCFMKAMADDNAAQFSRIYKDCRDEIAAPASEVVEFIGVPHGRINPRPFNAMLDMVRSATESIKVAVHRMTISRMMDEFVEKTEAGVNVQVVYDDDTLRGSVRDGGPILSMDPSDARSYWKLRDAGIEATFVETNAGSIKHLQHNKYLIVDDRVVFQGAGNFTSAALNVSSDGNFEQFYVLRDPGMVQAYVNAWAHLRTIATEREEHQVGNNPDRGIRFDREQNRWVFSDEQN